MLILSNLINNMYNVNWLELMAIYIVFIFIGGHFIIINKKDAIIAKLNEKISETVTKNIDLLREIIQMNEDFKLHEQNKIRLAEVNETLQTKVEMQKVLEKRVLELEATLQKRVEMQKVLEKNVLELEANLQKIVGKIYEIKMLIEI
jgi:hypothetical protein